MPSLPHNQTNFVSCENYFTLSKSDTLFPHFELSEMNFLRKLKKQKTKHDFKFEKMMFPSCVSGSLTMSRHVSIFCLDRCYFWTSSSSVFQVLVC